MALAGRISGVERTRAAHSRSLGKALPGGKVAKWVWGVVVVGISGAVMTGGLAAVVGETVVAATVTGGSVTGVVTVVAATVVSGVNHDRRRRSRRWFWPRNRGYGACAALAQQQHR